MNFSFQSENNKGEDVLKEDISKNPYIKYEHVPELEIINKNTIICDKKKYDIKEYNKLKNDNQEEFLEDIIHYNYCGKCKGNLNDFFL